MRATMISSAGGSATEGRGPHPHRAHRAFRIRQRPEVVSAPVSFRATALLVRHHWWSVPRVVFGSGGAHGPVELGALAYVLGGWSDADARRWLAAKPRTLVGISVGCLGAIATAMGLGVLRQVLLNRGFPMREVFGRDWAVSEQKVSEQTGAGLPPLVSQLLGLRGLLKGCSLRTVLHVIFRAGGVTDDGITFAQFRRRFGAELQVVVTNLSEVRPQVCSAALTPDVSVMEAAMGSMAIPLMFEPQTVRGVGECVDGGVVDPYGIGVRVLEPGVRTLWLAKVLNLRPERRTDSLMSVINGCMGAYAASTLELTGTGRPSSLDFLNLRVGARHGCDERDVSSSTDLFSPSDPADLVLDGLACAEAAVVTAWLALRMATTAARRERKAHGASQDPEGARSEMGYVSVQNRGETFGGSSGLPPGAQPLDRCAREAL
jgi:hypothetical protein